MSTDTSTDAVLAAQLAQMEVVGSGAEHPQVAQLPVHQQQHRDLLPEQLAKLRSDLDIVQKNVTVFAEMLAEQTDPAAIPEPDSRLLSDLARTNQQMQGRMMELIGYLGAVIGASGAGSASEGSGLLLEDLLRLNDQLNDSMRRFDRLRRAWHDLAGGSFNPMFDLAAESAAAAEPPALHPPSAAAQASRHPPPVANPAPDCQSPSKNPPLPATSGAANPGGLPDSEKELAEMETWMGDAGLLADQGAAPKPKAENESAVKHEPQ